MVALIVGAVVSLGSWLAVLIWNGCVSDVSHVGAAATYAGSASCARCHADVAARWRGSHHALAMRVAADSTVAADFAGTRFMYGGITTTFSRIGARFIVRTDGVDGALHDYEVKYTFGVAPLQQYLIALPGGRLQALEIAWDTRPRSAGGQRWFHLYPGQHVTHEDELHWTGIRQNWNYMCAECHSTGVRKRYDSLANTFATTFAAPNVGCEACHGPGSTHVRSGGTVAFARLDRATEIDRCARCHARREQFTDDYTPAQPLGDTHRVALLDAPLYYPDGQIRDEDFEYGSFVQSRMYAKWVVCSDCHDPHSATLRAPGSQSCAKCHAPSTYATRAHHFHPPQSRGADCVSCHMPTTAYMVVHERHDHSLRVPRPDLSVTLSVPNACNKCHGDRSAQWAAEKVEQWYGRPSRGYQRYANAFAAAAKEDTSAIRLLMLVAGGSNEPPIARATALQALGPRIDRSFDGAFEIMRAALSDTSALVRRAAVAAFAESDTGVRARMLAPLLQDSVRAVRMEASRALAGVRPVDLDEYVAAAAFNADRPEARVNLALLYAAQRRYGDAERELRAALVLAPRFVPALVNLADVFRATQRDADAEAVLRSALAIDSTNAATHHALGLLFAHEKRPAESVRELARAARLAPDVARYGFVYAIALDATNESRRADAELARVLSRHPFDRDALSLIVKRLAARGDTSGAMAYAARLAPK